MIVTSASSVEGHRVVSAAGLVQGSIVQSTHLGSETLTFAHDEAIDRMVTNARDLGANAVLDVRISTACIAGSVVEVLVYGNAVLLDT